MAGGGEGGGGLASASRTPKLTPRIFSALPRGGKKLCVILSHKRRVSPAAGSRTDSGTQRRETRSGIAFSRMGSRDNTILGREPFVLAPVMAPSVAAKI